MASVRIVEHQALDHQPQAVRVRVESPDQSEPQVIHAIVHTEPREPQVVRVRVVVAKEEPNVE